MRSGGPLIGVGVVSLAMALPAQAVAKEYCCYRVDVNASNQVHVEDQGGTGAGARNGPFDLNSKWEARELVLFSSPPRGDEYLPRVLARNQREVRGKARFEGGESSSQWRMDGSTSPPTRVDYPPCRYAYSRPWTRAPAAPQLVRLGVVRESPDVAAFFLSTRTDVGKVPGEYEGDCDNTAPYYDGFSPWFYPGRLDEAGDFDSYWDSFSSTINHFHAKPRAIFSKLRKLKDYKVTFEPGTITETSEVAGPHTYTVTHRTIVRFAWFPYDRLQKEINELNALK